MKRNAIAWVAIVVSTAALVSSRGVVRTMPAAPALQGEGQKTAKALSEAFESVAEFVKPSVVQISIQRKATSRRSGGHATPFGPQGGPNGGGIDPKDFEEMLKRFFGEGKSFEKEKEQFGNLAEGTGSGFVYDDKGHILTNDHVVKGADKITVMFHDGVEASATVVGTDPESDVAVIKVDIASYRPLPVGKSSKLKVGELVMAVGSPFGLSQSVTTGIISATERNNVGINAYESFLQTDAAINPGNSGGPLVDLNGQVVGINSAIMTGSRGNDGVGFAIPIDMASHVADKLIKNGKMSRARIGIALQPLTPAMAKQLGIDPKTKGALITDVLPDSPAAKAGLKAGDVITALRGQPISSVPAFRLNVAASDVGKSLDLTYYRNGKELTAEITPAPADKVVFTQEKKEEKAETPSVAEKAEIADFGLEVQPLTPALAAQFGLPKGTEGLLVSSVKEGSPADAAGLEAGNAITKVVKDKKIQAVTTVKDFQSLVKSADELAIYVQSGQGSRFVTLDKVKKN